MNRQCIVKKVLRGKNKGQWRFILRADNYEVLAHSESYHNLEDVMNMVYEYFPDFKIVIVNQKNEPIITSERTTGEGLEH